MEKQTTSPRVLPSILEQIRHRNHVKGVIAREVASLEDRIRQRRHATHMGFLERIATRVGIDLRNLVEEGRRRNRVERRILYRGYEGIRAKAKGLVREESLRLRRIRERYLELSSTPAKTDPVDPELKFVSPVDGGYWSEVEMDPPGGMLGGGRCRDPIFAERTSSDEMILADPPRNDYFHHFYPRVYAATGEDDSEVFITLRQNLTLRRNALDSGVGDFRVNRLSVNLSGVGYSERRFGEGSSFFFLDSCGSYGAQYVRLKVKIIQALAAAAHQGDFLEATLLSTDLYLLGMAALGPIVIELGTETFPCDFRILNPDNGGLEPWILFTLECHASSCNEDAWAEIDFTRPENEGLALGCVSLYGEYV